MTTLERIESLLPASQVVTDAELCSELSQDLFPAADKCRVVAVVSPHDAQQVAAVVHAADTDGLAVAARGGGMSYTAGFSQTERDCVLVDTRCLNRIREVNVDDRFVVVEAGVTWEKLNDALSSSGMRSAMRGPISGSVSTVGGALSQNLPGSMDAVLGLEVVTAQGESPFWTGSAGASGRRAFYRNFGPDLTGLFLGDAGSLGIKTAAALRLEPVPGGVAHASFAFETMADAVVAMTSVAALGAASRLFALDPLKNKTSTKVGLKEGLSTLAKVVKAGSGTRGITDAARIAVAGQHAFDNVKWSVHMSFEATSDRMATNLKHEAENACVQYGRAIDASIPVAMHARPFSIRGFLGIRGERWVPMHGIFPLSIAADVVPRLESFFDDRLDSLEQHGIVHSFMLSANPGFFVIEPMLYWPDRLLTAHRDNLHPKQLAKLARFSDNPAARAEVSAIRSELNELFTGLGAVTAQIGRFYAYRDTLEPATRAMFDQLKQALDPNHTMNPGALGTRTAKDR